MLYFMLQATLNVLRISQYFQRCLDGPGIESRWWARFSAPVQTGPGAHPALLYSGHWVFTRGKAAGAWC